ncbi:hypothetical protein HK097_010094 [Rhizophlyctis rosea]|uniref:J domain-containing protein n=1 Tax=Rhizophlyctis rosea TaxID=64517 RepID=A0AAD5X7I7_9FUNG|nr:hypothetical protein HK097_010094 [Rhizophlyctis rosea]
MGLGRSFDEKDLKVRYRNLSMMYHPDKLLGASEEEQSLHNARYLKIRHAYDVLKDPVLRAAYGSVMSTYLPLTTHNFNPTPDKFGDSVLSCSHCRTFRDHLFNFSSSYITFYTGSALFLIVLSILGKVEYGRYWRFVGMVGMAALEGKMLMQDSDPTAFLVPWRSTHERIAMLHQLFVVSSIALSQVGPMLYPEKIKSTKQLVEELDQLTNMQLKDSAEAFRSAFEPFADDPRAAGELQRKMEKLAIDLRLHEDAALQTAAAQARARRRP